jgi:hypothetical protein
MEREGENSEPKTQTGFRNKLKATLRVMKILIWGLGITSIFGGVLMGIRTPHSLWGLVPTAAFLFLSVLSLFRKEQPSGSGQLLWFVLCLCLIPLYFLRAQVWVPVVGGALFATYFWMHLESTGRSYPFMSVGCLLAGVLPLEVPWPNEQRCLLTLVGVGLTATLQGAWIIVCYLQGHRPPEQPEPGASSKEAVDKRTLRLLCLVFGTVGHVQIFSPAIERRIRMRYQSEIDQLQVLGFDYQFSDGETLPLLRMLLLFPALVVFTMWRKGEVIAIHDGTTYLVGHPVFISKNKTAFAEPSGLGTKFYTAFQDGSLLISKAYADGGMPSGSMIVKYAQEASIDETWAAHQERIAVLEAGGKRLDRRTSFHAYVEIERMESATR